VIQERRRELVRDVRRQSSCSDENQEGEDQISECGLLTNYGRIEREGETHELNTRTDTTQLTHRTY
jgi:hypothetical protein